MPTAKRLNVLDFCGENGKVRAASRRACLTYGQLVSFPLGFERGLMRSIIRASSLSRAPRGLAIRALACISLSFLAFHATAKNSGDPKLKSSSVLIVDQSDSSVLYSRNPDVAAPIASITKLMPALPVLDAKQPLDEPIQITEADRGHPKGASSRLTVGRPRARCGPVHLWLMASGTRAAHARGTT